MSEIQFVARAVIVQENHLLVAHAIGYDNTFLPGGHIEFNEGAKTTLTRECAEEFSGDIKVGDFIGVIEHTYEYQKKLFHEMNLLFASTLNNVKYPEKPKALEPHLEFYWYPVNKLEDINLLPELAREMIQRNGKKGIWASSFETSTKVA